MENILSIAMVMLFTLVNVNEEGIVITHSDSLSGKVTVDMERNEITLQNGREYKHLYAREIQKVILNSENKSYIAASFGLNEDFFLFELLSEGNVMLIYREGMKLSRYDETTYPPFFVKIGASVYSFGSDKKQVLEIMDSHKDDVKAFMKSEKISLDDRGDLIRLFDYYNELG